MELTEREVFENLTDFRSGGLRGGRSPHKPILILAALHRLKLGADDLATLDDFRPLVEAGLKSALPSGMDGDVAQPFWRLVNDGVWQILDDDSRDRVVANTTGPPPSWISQPSVRGGFTEAILSELRQNPKLIDDIENKILADLEIPSLNLGSQVLGFSRPEKWNLKKGDQIERRELKARYGGFEQGGINPSSITPNVWVIADPIIGPTHGYQMVQYRR